MSDVFVRLWDHLEPDVNMDFGSGIDSVQTGEILRRFEKVVQNRPDLLLVYGDIKSTVAAALVCANGIRMGLLKPGLHSFARTMPREINRLLTDSISENIGPDMARLFA